MSWFSEAIGAVSDVMGSVGGIFGGERSRHLARDEARRQEYYQSYMSNTAYQRAVLDLKKAGLNPVLAAFKGGASTPVGASARVPDLSGAYGQVPHTAVMLRRAAVEVNQLREQLGILKQQRKREGIETELLENAKKLYEGSALWKYAISGGMLGKMAGIPLGIGALGGIAHGGGVTGEMVSGKMRDAAEGVFGSFLTDMFFPNKKIGKPMSGGSKGSIVDPKDVPLPWDPAWMDKMEALLQKKRKEK